MGKRAKRRVKQRSKAHKKWVGKKRKVRTRSKSKIGYGARKRRRAKLNKKK
jgi:hypothetical protein